MKKITPITFALAAIFLIASCTPQQEKTESVPEVVVVEKQHITISTAEEALAELKAGNLRFLENQFINTDYAVQIEQTKDDQHPHSAILSCVDSRVPPEIIFDQGIGNIFVARVAGNVEDEYLVGSMEYAVKVKGTKLIVVLGHSHCGAVKGAVDNVELGNLTSLLDQIKPAITGNPDNMEEMLEETSKNNARMTVDDILVRSPVIKQLVDENKIQVVSAFYDISTGKVIFLD
ncbi:MAG TPA: carbonic anhydrase [Bacteroidales bacterium]